MCRSLQRTTNAASLISWFPFEFQNRGLLFSDLIGFGNLGLLKAAECYDSTKGFKFIAYAVWWIRQAILQGLTNLPHSTQSRRPDGDALAGGDTRLDISRIS